MKQLRQQTYRVLRMLLQYFRQAEIVESPEEIDKVWEQIKIQTARQQKIRQRRIFYVSTYAAATIAILITIGALVSGKFQLGYDTDWLEKYAMITDSIITNKSTDDIKLKLSNGKEVLIQSNGTVAYTSKNTLVVNKDTVHYETSKEENIDQIITPAGKQTQVVLADGTRLWVNASTRVIYPHEFKENLREIFVDGEVYLEVAHNEKAPFFVKTKNFSVQVLGTKFNVSSYQEEQLSSVVLVEGSVKVENKSQDKTILDPNQLIQIKDGYLEKPVKVDVNKYISWINNLLIYEEEPLPIVLKRLELYYGKKFIVKNNISDIQISGKLELKNSLSKVLHTLSYSFPIDFEEKEDSIWVMTRNN